MDHRIAVTSPFPHETETIDEVFKKGRDQKTCNFNFRNFVYFFLAFWKNGNIIGIKISESVVYYEDNVLALIVERRVQASIVTVGQSCLFLFNHYPFIYIFVTSVCMQNGNIMVGIWQINLLSPLQIQKLESFFSDYVHGLAI